VESIAGVGDSIVLGGVAGAAVTGDSELKLLSSFGFGETA
jgi:hypothetical protein